MKDKLLPIGSIIKMQEGEVYLMVCGYVDKKKLIENDHYDYFCCIYPAGVNGKDTILVQREKIEKVIFIGYQDNTFVKLAEMLEKE